MVDIRLVGAGPGSFGSGTGSYDSLGGSGVPASGSLTSDPFRYLADLESGLVQNYQVMKRDLGPVRAIQETYRSTAKYPALSSNSNAAAEKIIRTAEGSGAEALLFQAGVPYIPTANVSPTGQIVTSITPTRSHAVPVPAIPSIATNQATGTITGPTITGPVSPPPVPSVVAPPLQLAPPGPTNSSATGTTNPVLTIHVPAEAPPLAEQILASMREVNVTPPPPVESSEISRPIAGKRPVSLDTATPITGALVPSLVQVTSTVPSESVTPAPSPADLTAIEKLKQVPPTPPSIGSRLSDDAVAAVVAGAGAAGSSLIRDLVNKPIANVGQAVLDVIAPQPVPRVISSQTASTNFWLYLAIGIGAVIFLTRKR